MKKPQRLSPDLQKSLFYSKIEGMKFINKHRSFAVLFLSGIFMAILFMAAPFSTEASPLIPVGGLGAINQVGSFLYVDYQGSNTVSVVDTATNKIVNTIVVGHGPQGSSVVGTKLYINNNADNTVSVIDTLTNTVTNTISAGSLPADSVAVGTNVYINDSGSNQVSVIDTTNNAVTTISVGHNPNSLAVAGSNVYVMNADDGTVSVIDTLTNTVTSTITVGTNDVSAALVGTNLYVNNQDDETVSVIDTLTNTVTSTITLGANPGNTTVVGHYLYINDLPTNKISVVDTNTNTFIENITVADHPFTSTLVGGRYLYVNNFGSTNVDVVDTTNNTVTTSIPIGGASAFSRLVGSHLYVFTAIPGVIIIDTVTNTNVPVPPPLIQSATVNRSALTLTYDEILNSSPLPANGDFAVNDAGQALAVSHVTISGKTVVLTLAAPVVHDDVVTVSYTPGTHPIEDLTNSDAASLSNQVVTNNTTAATPAVSHATVSGISWGCKDPKATNYNFFSASKPELCKYAITSPNLSTVARTSTPTFTRVLKLGMKGDDVVTLQNYLKIIPVPSKIFGPKTKAAVILFQKTHGLTADGVVGQKTRSLMK